MGEAIISRRGGGGKLNIFTQTSQPSKENGLWIKSNDVKKVFVGNKEVSSGELEATGTVLSEARFGMGVASVGNIAYLFGGRVNHIQSLTTTAKEKLKVIQKYDTTTKILTTSSATLTQPAVFVPAVAVGTICYIFGGGTYYTEVGGGTTSTVYAFDTTTEVITSAGSIPRMLSAHSACAVGTKIYIFGGVYSEDDGEGGTTEVLSNKIYIYDTNSKSSTTASVTLPTAVYGASCAAIGNKCYVIGGGISASTLARLSKTVQIYDTSSNTIETVDIGYYVKNSGVGVAGTNIYLFGGSQSTSSTTSSISNAIKIFDVTSGTLSTASFTMTNSLTCVGSTYNSNGIYLFGGTTSLTTSGSPNTQISQMLIDTGLEDGTALVELSETSLYEAILYQSGKFTIQPKIKGVKLQLNGSLQTVEAAVINNSVVTTIA